MSTHLLKSAIADLVNRDGIVNSRIVLAAPAALETGAIGLSPDVAFLGLFLIIDTIFLNLC